MSKWKDSVVTIKAVTPVSNDSLSNIYGLGSDGKMYAWNYMAGRWQKHWDTTDE